MVKIHYGNALKKFKWNHYSIVADLRGCKVYCYRQDGGDYWKMDIYDGKNHLVYFVCDHEDLARMLEDFSNKTIWEILDECWTFEVSVNCLRREYDGGVLHVKNVEYSQFEDSGGEKLVLLTTLLPLKIMEKYDTTEFEKEYWEEVA